MNSQTGRQRQAGFTLIELLVVTAILGIVGVFASSYLITRASRADTGPVDPAVPLPELPLSPGELLVRLAGVAVLLFGAGFSYAAELYKPGRLDRFHLGQFLLLALTYCLFFVSFGVLYEEQVAGWLAVLIATAASSPLVVLHVATIIDMRFALCGALPLFLITTGIVVNGAYGEELRAYIYLAMACGVVAFLTLSYPRLQFARRRHASALEADVHQRVERLQEPLLDLRALVGDARQLLRRPDRTSLADYRCAVEQRLERATRSLDDAESMRGHHESLGHAADNAARTTAREQASYLAQRLLAQVPRQHQALLEACDLLTEQRQAATADRRRSEQAGHHCVACGAPTSSDAQYCSHCGQPGAERRICISCAAVLHLPRHLLRNGAAGPKPVTHCPSCGEAHAVAG